MDVKVGEILELDSINSRCDWLRDIHSYFKSSLKG